MKSTCSLAEAEILPHIRDATFPIIIAFSGRKDSIAMVLYLLEQGVDLDDSKRMGRRISLNLTIEQQLEAADVHIASLFFRTIGRLNGVVK